MDDERFGAVVDQSMLLLHLLAASSRMSKSIIAGCKRL